MGYKGMLGNKGAVAINFEIGQTRACVISVHFHSGQSKIKQRHKDFQEVKQKLISPKAKKAS